MLSDKQSVRDLVELCYLKGIKQVVISPGSRNAPLTISFAEHGSFECLSIIDERSAAFFALGLSQRSNTPTVLLCTSGSAMLNYAPAIAEAYYQHIPLFVISADRPKKWIDQGEGQSIRQYGAFNNYIRGSFELEESADTAGVEKNIRLINEALSRCLQPTPGPVHLNIPLDEPLYNKREYSEESLPNLSPTPSANLEIPPTQWSYLSETWQRSQKILILTGMMHSQDNLEKLLEKLAVKHSHLAILTETTSNLTSGKFTGNIDRNLTAIDSLQESDYIPDLLIVLGHNIISKKVKYWLRKHQLVEHWHIDAWGDFQNTFDQLTQKIQISPSKLFEYLLQLPASGRSEYSNKWESIALQTETWHKIFLTNCPWSDLKVFHHINENIPSGTSIQLSNSTVVRYMQLFHQKHPNTQSANRGVSGIDGCSSTAVGASWNDNNMTVFITGDIAFGYDANAYWHDYLHPRLKIIVLSNGGGGIFRFIEGPSTTAQFEQFFETPKSGHVLAIANRYDLPYYSAANEDELNDIFPQFIQNNISNRPSILEIFTPREHNDEVLKDYFEFIRQQCSRQHTSHSGHATQTRSNP